MAGQAGLERGCCEAGTEKRLGWRGASDASPSSAVMSRVLKQCVKSNVCLRKAGRSWPALDLCVFPLSSQSV